MARDKEFAMNIKSAVNGLLVAVLGFGSMLPAVAQASDDADAENFVWRESVPTYEFKHPLKVTCEEFLDTDAVYRPFVVAWLSGRTIGVLDIGDPDEFVPVSVPQVVTLCTEEPDTLVWELVRTQ